MNYLGKNNFCTHFLGVSEWGGGGGGGGGETVSVNHVDSFWFQSIAAFYAFLSRQFCYSLKSSSH